MCVCVCVCVCACVGVCAWVWCVRVGVGVVGVGVCATPDILCRTHMQDLKETTDKVHYENFRHSRLQQTQVAGESNI